MAGNGPPPAPNRRRRNVPARGDWVAAPGVGWQHGTIPEPPDGLCDVAREAWTTWMRSWFAARWLPADLPGLRTVIQLYDQCERYFADPYVERENRKGETVWVLRPNPTTELRQFADNYGITPKGQQDRRWTAPKDEDAPTAKPAAGSRYGALRVVNE